MTEKAQVNTVVNIYAKLKNWDALILEEKRRIRELNALLESNGEVYQMASYSRRNISDEYVSSKGLVHQIDARLEEAEEYLYEIQETLARSIYELMILNKKRLKLNLYISKLSEQEKILLKGFMEECPIKELGNEIKMSERTVRRKKQEIARQLEQLLNSDTAVGELLC